MLDYVYIVFMPPNGNLYCVYANGEFRFWESDGMWSPICIGAFVKTSRHGTVPDLYLVLKGIPDVGGKVKNE